MRWTGSRNGRDTAALSTLPNQANVSPSWKQEVNQRVAAHKDRKTVSAVEPETHSESLHNAGNRASAAAARVAARYANAPSYSEILANEARAAVRAAEAASRAALEAQAAAESVLAGLEAASAAEPSWELHSPEAGVEEPQAAGETGTGRHEGYSGGQGSREGSEQGLEREGFEIRWEPGLPARPTEIASVRATHGTEIPEAALDEWREPVWPAQDGPGGEAIVPVEPAQPIHANLIEFPREIVATRKVRPRLAEGPLGASGGQLSIFEVDPSSISTEPLLAGAAGVASAPTWTGPEWSGIELDAQPRQEFLEQAAEQTLNVEETQAHEAVDGARNLELAPLNLRMMAALVNGSLVLGAGLVAFLVTAANAKSLLPLREAEACAAVAIAVIAALYHGLFYAFSKGTPGMSYANISLCTFDGKRPTRAQRFGRLGALLLSVLPVGLGVVWAMFDEDHLSWHDRLSQTYLRKI
jgi:uncharacterized RDD family membrane protein YckC